MSWDIIAQDLPIGVRNVASIPDSFEPGPIGHRTEIITKLREVDPGIAFPNPDRGYIEGDRYSIEISLGSDGNDLIRSIGFHARGADQAAVIVADILDHLTLRALDSQTGEIFERETAMQSLQDWRAYRDRVLRGNQEG